MVAVAWFLHVRLRVRFLSHDEIVLMAKTITPRASADSQIKFKDGVQICPGWRRQLIKPSVLEKVRKLRVYNNPKVPVDEMKLSSYTEFYKRGISIIIRICLVIKKLNTVPLATVQA